MPYGNKMQPYLNVNQVVVHLNKPLDKWIRWNKAIECVQRVLTVPNTFMQVNRENSQLTYTMELLTVFKTVNLLEVFDTPITGF